MTRTTTLGNFQSCIAGLLYIFLVMLYIHKLTFCYSEILWCWITLCSELANFLELQYWNGFT